ERQPGRAAHAGLGERVAGVETMGFTLPHTPGGYMIAAHGARDTTPAEAPDARPPHRRPGGRAREIGGLGHRLRGRADADRRGARRRARSHDGSARGSPARTRGRGTEPPAARARARGREDPDAPLRALTSQRTADATAARN